MAMSNQLAHQSGVRNSIDRDALIASAVDACKHARAFTSTLQQTAEGYLRAVREAGRRLSLVHRSRGGRRKKNASGGLTSYQSAVKLADISRDTACVWRRVSEIRVADFERFIAEATRAGRDLTITDLLDLYHPSWSAPKKTHAITLHFSDADRRMFQHHANVLGGVHFTKNLSETVMAVLVRAYNEWLADQTRRFSASPTSTSISST
jgi:hypothetical protein